MTTKNKTAKEGRVLSSERIEDRPFDLIPASDSLKDRKVSFNTVCTYETLRTAINKLNLVSTGKNAEILDPFITSMVQCIKTVEFKGD